MVAISAQSTSEPFKIVLDCGVPCSNCAESTYIVIQKFDSIYYGAWLCCQTRYPSALDHITVGIKPYNRKAPKIPNTYQSQLGPFHICILCGGTENPQIDHIYSIHTCLRESLPWTLIHHYRNLRWLCSSCNRNKGKYSGIPDAMWFMWRTAYLARASQPLPRPPSWSVRPALSLA